MDLQDHDSICLKRCICTTGGNRVSVTIIIVGSTAGEDRLYDNPADQLAASMKAQLSPCRESVETEIAGSDLVIIVFNTPPCRSSAGALGSILVCTMKRCSQLRTRMAHAVKNYKSYGARELDEMQQLPARTRKMLRLHDLETQGIDSLAGYLLQVSQDNSGFSSPGESFAWQLAVGFLSYILPNMRGQIRSSLLGDDGLIRQDVLSIFGLTDVDPKRTLVVPRFHLILDERIVYSQQSASSTRPQILFPGSRKICDASADLCLEFDSQGYKKRIPANLMELEKPLMNGQSTYTHAVIFCGYAAPMFIMQKLSMSDEEKKLMFQQFRDELMFIQNHPRANEILREFSNISSEGFSESEPSALHVIDIVDEDSLRSSISGAIEEFLLCDGWSMVSKAIQQSSEESIQDELPLMSMAFAMAANTWFGFAQLLNDHIQQLSSGGEQIPFDLPYMFVIPKSGRFPDESQLLSRFAEIGVRSSLQEFRASSGRRYTFRVHEWRSRRMAFEIPTSVLGIRRQAECGVGGIGAAELPAHLSEFRAALGSFAADGGDLFKVVEWDDATGFDESSGIEPSIGLTACLLSALFVHNCI